MSNSPALVSDIDGGEKSDLHVDFKRTVRNFQQNSKYISKQRSPAVVDANPENQATFSKVPIFPSDKCIATQ